MNTRPVRPTTESGILWSAPEPAHETADRKDAMARSTRDGKRPIESYAHRHKERVNNQPVGLVTPETDFDVGQQKKRYAYDPRLIAIAMTIHARMRWNWPCWAQVNKGYQDSAKRCSVAR